MIPVSNTYKELVKSNIRPKCEPVIVVSGRVEDGEDVYMRWTANEIKELKFRRGIDPVGRELPYMELTWTEIYTGKLNEENYPEKYNNVCKYMAVDLRFVQDLLFSWESIKRQEAFFMPRMFLTARPTIQGNKITWVARDVLYFLESLQAKGFEPNIPYRNALRWFLLDERGNVRNSTEMLTALQNSQSNILKGDAETLKKNVVVEGRSKDILLGLANIKSYYWNFKENTAVLDSLFSLIDSMEFFPIETVYDFTSNVMYNYPTMRANPTLSAYSFKQYVCELDEGNKYTLSPYETLIKKGVKFYHYAYKGLGKPTDTTFTNEFGKATYSKENTLNITPANLNGIEFSINTANDGETFTEDNRCNPYNNTDREILDRVEYLSKYFKKGSYSAEVVSLPNVALETGDLVTTETNLFNGEKRVSKYAVVLKIELEYNGSLKQKTLLHTM